MSEEDKQKGKVYVKEYVTNIAKICLKKKK